MARPSVPANYVARCTGVQRLSDVAANFTDVTGVSRDAIECLPRGSTH